jgi:predicted dehydrogenase
MRVTALAADTDAGASTYALITLRMANGSVATVETSWAHPVAHGFHLITEIAGSEGRLRWTYDGIVLGSMVDREGRTTRFDPLADRGFRSEIGAFVHAIRHGLEPPVTAVEARSALATAVAARESVRTRTPVSMSQGGGG